MRIADRLYDVIPIKDQKTTIRNAPGAVPTTRLPALPLTHSLAARPILNQGDTP